MTCLNSLLQGDAVSRSVAERINIALVLAFVILSAVYSSINPVFEAPDEVYHYPYIKHVADGRGLPVQQVGNQEFWEQEGSQPPLYYAISALLTRWLDTDDLSIVRTLNPHATIGIPLAQDNKNMVVHGAWERWPWRRTVLAVHLVRFFSVLLGAGTLWGTGKLALALFPDRPATAVVAVLLTGLNPMFLFVSGAVNNDNLVVLLATVVLLLLTRLLRGGGRQTLSLTLVGVVIGLACLSKFSGLALIPLAVLALLMARFQRQPPEFAGARSLLGVLRSADLRSDLGTVFRGWLVDVAHVLLPALLVCGWWYWRNLYLYGDLTGLNAMLDVFGRREHPPGLAGLLSEFEGFRISYWGLFGVVNVLLRPSWIYKLLDGLVILCCIGLLGMTYGQLRAGCRPKRVRPLALSSLWVLAVCLSLVRWTSMTKASQGRLVFPAIAATSTFLAAGYLTWFPERRTNLAVWCIALPLAALAVTAPFTAIRPAYSLPEILSERDIPLTAQGFGATYGPSIRLLAHEIGAESVLPGSEFPVTLYWECLQPMEKDYSLYIHVFGAGGQPLGQRDSYPGGGMYPTSQWRSGDIIADTYLVPVGANVSRPVAAQVEVGVYDLQSMTPLQVTDPSGQPVGRPVIGRIKVNVPTQPSRPQRILNADLRSVLLRGCDLSAEQVCPGDRISVTLHWQVKSAMPADYHVFVHLVDQESNMVGQGDGPPLNGDYATQFWAAGEYLVDEHVLLVEPETSAGTYTLLVGLYDRQSGQRLAIRTGDSDAANDQVPVASIRVRDCR